jgi:hypothetical protein
LVKNKFMSKMLTNNKRKMCSKADRTSSKCSSEKSRTIKGCLANSRMFRIKMESLRMVAARLRFYLRLITKKKNTQRIIKKFKSSNSP